MNFAYSRQMLGRGKLLKLFKVSCKLFQHIFMACLQPIRGCLSFDPEINYNGVQNYALSFAGYASKGWFTSVGVGDGTSLGQLTRFTRLRKKLVVFGYWLLQRDSFCWNQVFSVETTPSQSGFEIGTSRTRQGSSVGGRTFIDNDGINSSNGASTTMEDRPAARPFARGRTSCCRSRCT